MARWEDLSIDDQLTCLLISMGIRKPTRSKCMASDKKEEKKSLRYRTPRDKYLNDPDYAALVKMMMHFIRDARFTPSELREACVFAAICEEETRTRTYPWRP